MIGYVQTGSETAKDDLLTPIWRAKTKVIPNVVSLPTNMDYASWFQMQKIGGTLPNIIASSNGIFDNTGLYNALVKNDTLQSITLQEIKDYMPLTCQRLQKWGISVDDWYKANVDPSTGKLWYIPGAPNLALTNLKDEDFVKESNSFEPVTYYFRDDILKKIFPNAKSEAELMALYKKNNGKLTYDEINDVPIHNLNDLQSYLEKVKALNLKSNGQSVIPIQMQSSGTDASSLMWSDFTATGLFWQFGDRVYDNNNQKFTYFTETSEWQNFIKTLNHWYNEKLLDPETFIMKDDQLKSKVTQGQFAAFQGWLDVADARANSTKANPSYGYRKVALFLNDKLTNNEEDYTTKTYSLLNTWSAVGITTSAKKSDIPQILNWIDWNQSEEANILRAWGTPDMYTGAGKDRRFLSDYKEVEDWALGNYSATTPKDGVYYGLYNINGGTPTAWNAETYGVGQSWKYEYAPGNVYPPNVTSASDGDVDVAYDKAVELHYYPMFKQYVEKPLGEDVTALYAKFNDLQGDTFTNIKKTASFDSDGGKTATIKAIVGSEADFASNWAKYESTYITKALKDNIQQQADAWFAYWKLYSSKYLEPLS